MTISATPRKRDKLAAQLTWLANRHILNLPEDRRHGRYRAAQSGRAPDHAERHQRRLPHHRHVAVGRRASRPSSGPTIGSARHARQDRRAGWCATSKTASPSSSPGCSTRTSSKRTSPAGKRRHAPLPTARAERHYRRPQCVSLRARWHTADARGVNAPAMRAAQVRATSRHQPR